MPIISSCPCLDMKTMGTQWLMLPWIQQGVICGGGSYLLFDYYHSLPSASQVQEECFSQCQAGKRKEERNAVACFSGGGGVSLSRSSLFIFEEKSFPKDSI